MARRLDRRKAAAARRRRHRGGRQQHGDRRAPTLSAYPAGFDPGSSQVAVSYNGISGLSGVSSNGYTTSGGSFPVTVLSSLGIDNQVVSSTGFTAGDYTTQTVVTCS